MIMNPPTVATAIFFCCLFTGSAGTADAGGEDPMNPDSRAIVKTMMVPMSKSIQSGIRRAVSKGMPTDTGGIETPYIDLDSNNRILLMFPKQHMLLILPEDPQSGDHWSELTIGKKTTVSVDFSESVPMKGSEDPAQNRGWKYYDFKALSRGETTLSCALKDPASEPRNFSIRIIVVDRE